MVVSTTRGQLQPPRTEATDTTLSSTSEMFEENKYASASFDEENLDEHHVTSKFVEAMKNPDWRRRPENTKSSTSTYSGFCTSKTNDSQPQTDFEGIYSKYPSGGQHKMGRVGPWDHIAFSHRMSSHGGSEADTEPTETLGSEDMGKIRTGSEHWGLCGLVKQTELQEHGSNGEPMSIIELVPFWADEDSMYRPKKPGFPQDPRKMPRNEQERELAAVLAATEATPPRMAAAASKRQSQIKLQTDNLSKTQMMEDMRQTVFDKPVVAPIYDAQRLSMGSSKPSTTGSFQRDNPDLKKKHAAFQRMLEKLHRGANQMTKAS
ncbi:hypothetical protein B0J13DRAFT_663101 [Dactylonectria estremocensis]|uniref:Uncharacterized protein n=1 Tax=Dactylonectria estremocensis TaxID=1079267 RepID=A0A9P9F069_9HYPO|nr:hypothetical protein B0J13DRAFT_663101 [Dactylonectria estremocensis]